MTTHSSWLSSLTITKPHFSWHLFNKKAQETEGEMGLKHHLLILPMPQVDNLVQLAIS